MVNQNTRDSHQDPKKNESDTQKLVRKHMEDKNHTITEEEIRSLRVGETPHETFITAENEEIEKRVSEISDDIREERNEEDSPPARDDRITPWDVTT